MVRRHPICAAAFATLGAALLLAGCEARITEVVVVVDSTLRVPQDVDALDVRVNTTGRMVPGLDAPLTGPDAVAPPLTLGLRSDGSLWAWGENRDGQLGSGNFNETLEPVRVALP